MVIVVMYVLVWVDGLIGFYLIREIMVIYKEVVMFVEIFFINIECMDYM